MDVLHWAASCLITLLHIVGIHGYVLEMITEGQRYVVDRGESIILLCDFTAENYNLFDYPVLWTKKQHHEHYQINIMGNLNKPFVDSGRFHVNFSPDPPKHRLELLISEVMPEDSGNYSCDIRGPSSIVLTSVTHNVYIKNPIESIVLQAANHTVGITNMQQDQPRHSRRVTMVEQTFNSVRCVVNGGYPAPKLIMKLGGKDITRHFKQISTPKLSGKPGLRIITYMSEIWTDSFVPAPENDGKKMKCIASIPGLTNNQTVLKLDVHYAPEIECHNLGVFVGERNAALRCQIRFKPELNNLFWIIDVNGTSLMAGEDVNGFWILNAENSAAYRETQLIVTQVREENFRTYTVVAENDVAATTRNVQLIKREATTTRRPMHTDAYVIASQDKYVPLNSDPGLYISHWILCTAVSWTMYISWRW